MFGSFYKNKLLCKRVRVDLLKHPISYKSMSEGGKGKQEHQKEKLN